MKKNNNKNKTKYADKTRINSGFLMLLQQRRMAAVEEKEEEEPETKERDASV
jgi:hypothetical protein